MKAEIISVGTELLLGHVINKDTAYIARELANCGIDINRTQVVGDNARRLMNALKIAAEDCDLIFTTGGLGPTKDDLTKETAARFANLPLQEDPDTLDSLKEYFGTRPMTDNQYKQALIPRGAIVFPNLFGTAPGMAIPFDEHKFIILLPGPPSELLPMLEKSVRPYLLNIENKKILSISIKTFGIGEGEAAAKLADLLDSANPTVAPYASGGEMFVKVTAKASDDVQARLLILPVMDEIKRRLGSLIYGIDVANLEDVVVKKLIEEKKTIATAESCTGGLLAKRITDIPGASAVFGLGLVTYANEAKEKILSVPESLLNEYGAVSSEVACEMAKNVRDLAKSTFGLAITGIAGPDGGTSEKPLGLVYIALASKNSVEVRKMLPGGKYHGRDWIRTRASSHALDMLRRLLFQLPFTIENEKIWQ